jgi:hypothetical protein
MSKRDPVPCNWLLILNTKNTYQNGGHDEKVLCPKDFLRSLYAFNPSVNWFLKKWLLIVTQEILVTKLLRVTSEQDRQCTYNITLACVCITIVTVEKQ